MLKPNISEAAGKLADSISLMASSIGRPLRLMEVCGTHTVAIFKSGLRSLLPPEIRLLSGPGCPVCVTGVEDVDRAIDIAKIPGVTLMTFGDMMRVPGSASSLMLEKAKGADIKIVYSPMDCLRAARENPKRKIVFFATGFETTSPSIAATAIEAKRQGIGNFHIYSVHKTVPPALRALMGSPGIKIDGFILPGHVSAIIGERPYGFLASEFRTPSVIAGFEALDILQAICMLLAQIKENRPAVENQYTLAVRAEGNSKAVSLLREVFSPADADWRGIGIIPLSGLKLRGNYSEFDAEATFDLTILKPQEARTSTGCKCGEVMRGIIVPTDCPLFGRACTPERPVGACMVSTEGSCAAYYKYGGHEPINRLQGERDWT